MEKKVFRIYEYEADDNRYPYYPHYHQLARLFLQAVLEAALIALLGEYMGMSEILLTWEAGEEGL